MTYIDSIKSVYPNVLVIDCGDFCGRNLERERYKSKFLLDFYLNSPYDVVEIGEKELFFDYKDVIDKTRDSKIDFVSANLYERDSGKLVFKPYAIKKFDGVRVGVIGLLGKGLRLRPEEVSTSLQIEDQLEAAKKFVPELRKKADVVVLLAHMGYPATRDLLDAVEGIDVAIVGHGPGFSIKPYERGGTWVVRSGQRGQSVAELHLKVDDSGVTDRELNVVKLDAKIAKDPEVDRLVKQFNKEERKRAQKLAEEKAARKRPAAAEDQFLGVEESCKKCHRPQYEQWRKTRHAGAYESLVKSNKNYDQDCLACHVTGLGKPGGFVSPYDGLKMKGVQCESCHGMGTDHRRDGTYGRVDEATCIVCHDRENSPDFVYSSYLKEIVH